jgi:hypothetical protein
MLWWSFQGVPGDTLSFKPYSFGLATGMEGQRNKKYRLFVKVKHGTSEILERGMYLITMHIE